MRKVFLCCPENCNGRGFLAFALRLFGACLALLSFAAGAQDKDKFRGQTYSETSSASFTTAGPMNAARSGHSQTLLPDGKVLLTGGSFQIAAELFDPDTNTFTVLPAGAVSDRVYGSATALADGRVLLAGGTDGGGIVNAEIFDPANLSSTPIAEKMISPRYGHTATLLPTGKVLICGGQSLTGVSNTGELFDPVNESFSPVASTLSVPRYVHTATPLSDGRVLIAGGYSGSGAYSGTNTADIFDPTTENFVPVASLMNSARYGHTATLLPNGKVLLAGGWSRNAPVASAEIFDPTTLTFSALANAMTSAREAHTATLLMNGNVLIAGGDDGQIDLTTAELFDPSSETFTSLSPIVMNSAHRQHTATLLPRGGVLIAGGTVGQYAVNKAELFDLTPVHLVSAISRKVHGSAGTFDVDLPLTGPRGIECRRGGANGDYTMILTFADTLTGIGRVSLTNGTGTVSTSNIDTNDAHHYIVNLTGLSNGQIVTVSLTNVQDASGNSSSVVPVSMGVLVGDTTDDGSVNSADIGQTKSQSGHLVTASNFREDVTVDGSINSADIGLVKSKSGTGLPQ